MEYDEKETELAKYLKNSTALRNLYKQCISYGLNNSGEEWTDWINAGDEFAKISFDIYHHGFKFKQETLTKLYNMKLPNNIIVVNRVLKIIKLDNE